MDNRGFFRHALVYGMASLLMQAGGVVLLPLYTRYLSPADFGILEVLGRFAEVVGTCLLVSGLRQAMLTFYQQADRQAECRRVVSGTLALLVCSCLLGGGLVLGFAPALTYLLGKGGSAVSPNLLRLAVAGVLLESFGLFALTLIQARVESTTFVLITLSQFVVRVLLCVVFVAILDWGVLGVLAATALTAGSYGVALSSRELLRYAAWPDWRHVRDLLRFSLPFLPGGVCFFLLQHGDRFFLLAWRNEEEVGTYSLGYKLALAVGMFSMGPLYMVWSSHMYEAARSADAPGVFGRVFTRILGAYLLVGLALCLLQDEVVVVLGGGRYAGAAEVILPVVLAGFCQTAASIMDAGFYVRRRTDLKLWITLAATALTLGLYVALIPSLGGMGAALATLGGFALHAACTWRVTQRVFPVRYEWGRVAALFALAAGLWLLSRLLPVGPWAVAVKAGMWLLWPVFVWQLGLATPDEKQHVRDLVRQWMEPLGRRIRRWQLSSKPQAVE